MGITSETVGIKNESILFQGADDDNPMILLAPTTVHPIISHYIHIPLSRSLHSFVDSRSAFFLHRWLTMNLWYIIAIFWSGGYKVVPAPVRNMGYNPINYRYIYLTSPINHSYWTYVHQLQAPHGSRPPVSNKRSVFFPRATLSPPKL